MRSIELAAVLLLSSASIVSGASSPFSGLAADIRGSGSVHPLVHVEVTDSAAADTIALSGWAVPRANAGVGVRGQGGHMGVLAFATEPGLGSRFGVYGTAAGGSDLNVGLYGTATGGVSALAVYSEGDLHYTGSLIGPVSDIRLKENLAPLESSLPRIMDLEVVSFEHTRDPRFSEINLPEGPQVGFVAQQVAGIFPDLVTEVVHPRTYDPDGGGPAGDEAGEPMSFLALRQIQMIPHLVRAIQEQQVEIEALRSQLGPLQRRLAELEGDVDNGGVLTSAR